MIAPATRAGSGLAAAEALVRLHHHFHGPPLGYLAIALAAFASWAGVPGPGEPVLIAGALYAARGRLDLAEVLLTAWAGAVSGGVVGWLVGHRGGRPLFTAAGPLRRHRLRAVERGERFFDRFGLLAVYLAPSWVAGVAQMAARRFLPANVVAAAVWVVLIGLGAYAAGPAIAESLGDVGLAGLVAIVVAATLLALARHVRRRRARPRT
jgi:membrane protein DedA with SNARE-associated domain